MQPFQFQSDGELRAMLRAVGGGCGVRVGDRYLDPALFQTDPLSIPFDDVRVSGESPVVHCLTADVKDVPHQETVTVQGDEAVYYIQNKREESGITVLELRKE